MKLQADEQRRSLLQECTIIMSRNIVTFSTLIFDQNRSYILGQSGNE